MTAVEWGASTDPHAMLAHLRREWDKGGEYYAVTDRQLRAFVEAAGCAQCVELARTMDDYDAAHYAAGADCGNQTTKAALLRCIIPFRPLALGEACQRCEGGVERVGFGHSRSCVACGGTGRTPPPWLTASVRATARTIHEGRCWEALPMLADEAEEAGCPSSVACPECGGLGYVQTADGSGDSCPSCHGTGRAPHPLLQHLRGPVCVHCKGVGFHKTGLVKCDAFGIHDSREDIQCVACNGSGRLPALHCRGCHALDALLGEVTR